ncbi:MAG: hypothetical protein Q8P15_02300 [Nanoarchaeota archaeon]|nr:hypothetical protein [Nanoarchaeota archaeon]
MEEPTQHKNWHDKYYKLLLLIPIAIMIFSLIYLGNFYSKNNDFIYKDISLTGGTSVTLYEKINVDDLKQSLSEKLDDINTKEIYDLLTNEQKAIIVETKTEGAETKKILEEYLGHELTSENSSFEFTGSTLSESFYKQLLLAIFYAFLFMGFVVFLIFGKNLKLKMILGTLILLNPFLFFVLKILTINQAIIFAIISLVISLIFYLKNNIPSFAVIIAAFADILMTLTLVNILGIKMSSAGIIAFLMLIGYSVDTDILLTNKVLKRTEGDVNQRIIGAFKTGILMTLTSLIAIGFALFVVKSFSGVLTQIFTILVIGLGFDIFNTWITNVSILKWYVEKRK